jgi:hypothetical protein
MSYANVLEQAAIQRALDRYHWQEEAEARREAHVSHMATWIADEVIADTKDSARRAQFMEELVDSEDWLLFLRDLLDDVHHGVDPTQTIRRRVANWALTVAEEEDERGEA